MKKHLTVISLYLVVAILLVIGAAHFSPKENWKLVDIVYFNGDRPSTTKSFSVIIDRDYRTKEFCDALTKEDLNWNNIEKIEFIPFPPYKYLTVYLKKQSEKELRMAILHCGKLEFVEYACFQLIMYGSG